LNREVSNYISVREILVKFRQIRPGGALGYTVPVHWGFPRFRIVFRKLDERSLTDDPHTNRLPNWELYSNNSGGSVCQARSGNRGGKSSLTGFFAYLQCK
jgi:hypothetical protein